METKQNDLAKLFENDSDDEDDCVDDTVFHSIAPPIKDQEELDDYFMFCTQCYKMHLEAIDEEDLEFGKARLAAEKKVLFTALKTNLLPRRLELEESLNPKFAVNHDKTVNISDVKFHFEESFDDVRRYCVIALKVHNQLLLSEYTQADSEGIFEFNINHTFSELPEQWRMHLHIFLLTLEKKGPKDTTPAVAAEISGFKRPSLFSIYESIVVAPSYESGDHEIYIDPSIREKIVFNLAIH